MFLDELMAAIADFYTENSPSAHPEGWSVLCGTVLRDIMCGIAAKITDVGEEEGGGVLVHFMDCSKCETVSQE